MLLPDGYSDVPAGKIAAVVTHLEMTERPILPPDPPGAWTLRRVERPDPDWFRELYRRIGEEWLWFSRLRMSDAELAAQRAARERADADEGLLHLDFSAEGQCELSLFGVTAQLIGGGAGRFMMNRALERAWSEGITRVWVHTCSFDHPKALAFYQRSGFRPFRLQIEIADDPRLDGTVPRHVAKHVLLVV